MQQLAYIALFAWPVLGAASFLWLPVRVAMLSTFLGGWMFLPMAGIDFQGAPTYNKTAAIAVGILGGLALRGELGRLFDVRPHWLDLPMAVWVVLLPMASAISVGTGIYDGASGIFDHLVLWGLPYWLGRAYFSEPGNVRLLATAIVIAGLIYVPLCLYEMRFSPQLHNIFYGFHQHDFRQTLRFGGYRPMVFMTHGLMVAMFMATASLMALGLWHSGAVRRLLGVPMGVWVVVLLLTTLLARSTGAVGLLVIGGAALLVSERTRLVAPLIALALIPPIYVFSRLGQTQLPQHMVAAAEVIAGPDRADSLNFRIENEEALMGRAYEAPIFGWRGWNYARQVRPGLEPHEMPVAESMWILAFGHFGLVGLATYLTVMLLPPVLLFRRLPRPVLGHPLGAPVACLSLGAILFAIDSMFNAMLNPMFMLMVGTITGLYIQATQRRPAPAPQPLAV